MVKLLRVVVKARTSSLLLNHFWHNYVHVVARTESVHLATSAVERRPRHVHVEPARVRLNSSRLVMVHSRRFLIVVNFHTLISNKSTPLPLALPVLTKKVVYSVLHLASLLLYLRIPNTLLR